MADVCGPWTLEGLDQFGTLDSLAFSLDSPIWDSADTCVLSAEASAAGLATIQISPVVTKIAGASVIGEAATLALGGFFLEGSAAVLGQGGVVADGGLISFASGDIIGEGFAFASPSVIFLAESAVLGRATISASGTIMGEEWQDVPTGSNIWIPVTEGMNTWLRNG
jgi:hypothetical protein